MLHLFCNKWMETCLLLMSKAGRIMGVWRCVRWANVNVLRINAWSLLYIHGVIMKHVAMIHRTIGINILTKSKNISWNIMEFSCLHPMYRNTFPASQAQPYLCAILSYWTACLCVSPYLPSFPLTSTFLNSKKLYSKHFPRWYVIIPLYFIKHQTSCCSSQLLLAFPPATLPK